MTNKKGYDEQRVVDQLNRKHDLFIPRGRKNIFMLFGSSAKGDIGIKSKGKIDFLHKYHGYIPTWVTAFRND